MAPLIELERLEVRFGRRRILKGLSGSFSGEAIGLLGPNGAGKTTLIHTLLGLVAPAAGTARLGGFEIRREARQLKAAAGYMPENDAFIASMTGVGFVRLMAELAGLPPAAAMERAHEALFYVGLGEARYRRLGTYSTGMKQMVKLAQAIAHGPRLLVLDEPTNGLDPPARERMLELIRQIRASGQARLLISSHLLRDVEETCDQVLILKDGRIAAFCDLNEERRTHRRWIELEARAAGPAFLEEIRRSGYEASWLPGGRGRLTLPDGLTTRPLFEIAARHNVQLVRLSYKRDSLEELFFRAMEAPDGGP
jgi:ABC-2 type transport system ATP-binding protein